MSESQMILNYSSDVSTAEAPEPIPVGDYIGTVVSAEAAVSKSSGNHYVNLAFRIDPDQYPADFSAEGWEDGVILYWRRTVIEDSTRGRYQMRRLCETLDAPMGGSINLAEWAGLEAKLTVGHQTNPNDGTLVAEIQKLEHVSA